MMDSVNHPKHYQIGDTGIEAIDIIEAITKEGSLNGFENYCLGNVLKYILRANKKNGIEDYKKAKVYLNWLIESIESESDKKTSNGNTPINGDYYYKGYYFEFDKDMSTCYMKCKANESNYIVDDIMIDEFGYPLFDIDEYGYYLLDVRGMSNKIWENKNSRNQFIDEWVGELEKDS